jgi:hypothetical protein
MMVAKDRRTVQVPVLGAGHFVEHLGSSAKGIAAMEG